MHMKPANKCQARQNDVALGALAPWIQIKFSGATVPLLNDINVYNYTI